ncbi:MAG TPA: DUF2971 domain-containing protein [Clostridia bacterium]|nr:DUF2971 domain-containing protein [Clostridia bacterium]
MNEFYNKMNYFENIEKIPAETYYHYTSLDALYSIVASKTIRLTSLKSSNDKKELYYKPEEFLSDFLKVCDNEKDINTKKCLRLIDESIKLNKNSFFEECKTKAFPYALCLSEKKDNLTHWDRYASACTGVCIGFNVSSLRVHMQRMAVTAFGIGLYDIGKVFYSSEQKEKHIRNVIIYLINALDENGEIESNDIKEIIRKNGYMYAASACIQLMKFSKNSLFVDEDEVRLYHDSTSIKGSLRLIDLMASNIEPELHKNLKKHFLDLVKQLHLEEERFCMTKSGIRSYRELYLEEIWGSGTIPEIILGPMCIQNRNELRRFLKANGLEGTKISVSKVPIR